MPRPRVAAFMVLFLWVLAAYQTSAAERHVAEQRADYLSAKKAFEAGELTRYQQLKRGLKNYSLYPYLEYAELRNGLKLDSKREVTAFLEEYHDLAVADRLRASWLSYLGRKKHWQALLEYYDDSLADTTLRCYYLRALLQDGKEEEVWPAIAGLWLVGKSQPKACDPLFERWADAGLKTPALTWQRFKLAMQKRQLGLARYLMGTMQEPNKQAAEKFIRYHNSPALVKRKGRLSPRSSQDADLALNAIIRLARTDTISAAAQLDKLATQFTFDPVDFSAAQKWIAYYILSEPSRKGLDWARQQLVDGIDPDVAVYAARIALHFEHWSTVLQAIKLMPASLQDTNRWQYWHAKASMMENPKLDQIWKHDAFGELAGQRDYYGFLAALLLERSFDFNDHAISFSPDFRRKIEEIHGVKVALELFAAGQKVSARREWRHALRNLPDTHVVAAGHIASSWGWSSEAVYTTIMARAWDELTLRFPLNFQEYMRRGTHRADIDIAWAYAIARQESAMNPKAVSHAGAKGLMQLMPATAKATIRRNSLPLESPQLLDERDNTWIATAHLGELARYYNGNRILASAAYNAGKSRSDKWLKRTRRSMAFDVWVETIPFKETRQYVQNVLMFAAIYNYRMGRDIVFIKPDEWIINP